MRRYRLALLLAVGGVLALLAMHGVSAHGLGAGLGHDEHAAWETSAAVAGFATVAAHDHGSDHHDDHDHGGLPCQTCGHGTAALCALIVLGLVVIPRRTTSRMFLRLTPAPRPPRRTWTPDPPVPKFGLVLTTL